VTCLDWIDDAEEALEQHYSGDVLVYSRPPNSEPGFAPPRSELPGTEQ
jgi:hypothetical protein